MIPSPRNGAIVHIDAPSSQSSELGLCYGFGGQEYQYLLSATFNTTFQCGTQYGSAYEETESLSVSDRRENAQPLTSRPETMHGEGEDETYGDDGFEEYSDEFESDESETVGKNPSPNKKLTSQPALPNRYQTGSLVQVYWADERRWFNGRVAGCDACRCFVIYDDGDQQWEQVEAIRQAPPWNDGEQLQLLGIASHAIIGRRAVVYWKDQERWFGGSITNVANTQVQITYDDGETQWIPEGKFPDVVLKTSMGEPPGNQCGHETTDCNGRIITPRNYTPVVASHFEPLRVARPYHPLLKNHLGSIVVVRNRDSRVSRPNYSRAMPSLEYSSIAPGRDLSNATRNCQVQTDITIEMVTST